MFTRQEIVRLSRWKRGTPFVPSYLRSGANNSPFEGGALQEREMWLFGLLNFHRKGEITPLASARRSPRGKRIRCAVRVYPDRKNFSVMASGQAPTATEDNRFSLCESGIRLTAFISHLWCEYSPLSRGVDSRYKVSRRRGVSGVVHSNNLSNGLLNSNPVYGASSRCLIAQI